jgi:hypothetical protein
LEDGHGNDDSNFDSGGNSQDPYYYGNDESPFLCGDDDDDYGESADGAGYNTEIGEVINSAAADHNSRDNDRDDFNPTLPMTREEQLVERESIKASMKNTKDVEDTPQTNGKDAQAVQRIKDNFYPEYILDAAARDVLVIILIPVFRKHKIIC